MSSPPSGSRTVRYLLPLLVGIADTLVILAYVWLITFGTWTRWATPEKSYDQLATSFQHGKLALEPRPNPALLALPDPYDPAQRGDLPYLPNTSLYQGKYYLYFGPAPAVLLALLKALFAVSLSDTALTLLFLSGIFLILSLFLLRIWRLYFQGLPSWTIIPALLSLGLTTPYPWMLYSPGLTTAAIAAGQFFFLAGLYVALLGVGRSSAAPLFFAAAGTCWALSVGSRLTHLVPIAFVSVLLVIWAATGSTPELRWRKAISTALCLALPLAAGLLALALYNHARFGSFLETGFSYALTGQDLRANQHALFSPVYIAQNLYNYFLTLPRLIPRFPFLAAAKGSTHSILSFIALPGIYYSQELAGLLYISPWIALALLPALTIVQARRVVMPASVTDARPNGLSLNHLSIALLGSFAFGLAPLLVFFWAATRYLLDFVPSLMLLALIGYGQGLQWARGKPLVRVLITAVGIGLIAYSIMASNLVAMSVNSTGFKHLNPLLWKQLTSLFRP